MRGDATSVPSHGSSSAEEPSISALAFSIRCTRSATWTARGSAFPAAQPCARVGRATRPRSPGCPPAMPRWPHFHDPFAASGSAAVRGGSDAAVAVIATEPLRVPPHQASLEVGPGPLRPVVDADYRERISGSSVSASHHAELRSVAHWRHQALGELTPGRPRRASPKVMDDAVEPRRAARPCRDFAGIEGLCEDPLPAVRLPGSEP